MLLQRAAERGSRVSAGALKTRLGVLDGEAQIIRLVKKEFVNTGCNPVVGDLGHDSDILPECHGEAWKH